jgi:hypothetical protein
MKQFKWRFNIFTLEIYSKEPLRVKLILENRENISWLL